MKRLVGLLAVLAMATLGAGAVAGAAPPRFQHLDPGGPARLHERVPVNFVFVGYNRDDVNQDGFMRGLPGAYRVVARSRVAFGLPRALLGLNYTYDYDVHYADTAYENRFFTRLNALARPAPLTDFQIAYNQQNNNVRRVQNNHYIDAPSVERWLAYNAPQGVDTTENTIFFVNWFGRHDFKHHVYTKLDEPDPDTGYNFGRERASRKIIAWGGTPANDEESGLGSTRRVWFHDLSAGPESWTDNWNVDNPDLDGNGEVDYRMPPSWEYRPGGFRARTALTGDLAKVARYVGLDLLFTASPLYPPEITPPDLPLEINLDSNTYEGWPGVDASTRYITQNLLLSELRELQPPNQFDYDNEDLAFAGKARRCYVRWLQDVSCYPRRPYPADANLFIYHALNRGEFLDDRGRVDYEAGLFNFATTRRLSAPILGFAPTNYQDGTQSFVFSFVAPDIVELGYGLTTTMIHEYGHHAGMSHPHDGWDWQSRTDFVPADAFYFAWAGDESNSIMSYIDVNWDFSQFDRDNMSRYLAAAFIENANEIAADILRDPDAGRASDELEQADAAIGRARAALRQHDYSASMRHAAQAYRLVREGAREAGVRVVGDQSAFQVDPPQQARRLARSTYVDGIGPNSHRARP